MIPFVDLQAQYRSIKDEVRSAIDRVLDSGQFVLGPEVQQFEQQFAAYCGCAHAIAVNTGTSALHLALLAAGVGPNDEVITVPHTFVATVAAIGYTGARTVFVDIDPTTYTLDPDQLEQAITPRTKALLPVHLYGQIADMDAILAIAHKHGLVVIEDAAQAHGATYNGRPAGSLGALGCFSLYPGKNLGAYGEGGAVTTNDAAFARRIRLLRDWGAERRYHHDLRGFNFRMEALQGAILSVKLRYLEQWTEARRACAARYRELLAGCGVDLPREATERRHVYHIYAIRHPQRDALQAYLHEHGVATGIHYPIPVHLQHGYADLGYRAGDFPHAEQAAREVLSLPMYPELQPAQQEYIAAVIRQGGAR